MKISCYLFIVANPKLIGHGVFLIVVSKNDWHRCWHKWFETDAVALREAHMMGLASRDFGPSGDKLSFKVFPEAILDTKMLDYEWIVGRPRGLPML